MPKVDLPVTHRSFSRCQPPIALALHCFPESYRCALQAVESAQQISGDYRGELRIANVGLICPSLLARLIGAFHERFPKVEVSVLQQNNFKWIEAAQKRADLGIGFLSDVGPAGRQSAG